METMFGNVFTENGAVYTRSAYPGHRVYGERIVTADDREYREWSPRRSKLAAYIALGGRHVPIASGSRILYLGAASGTTASHVSDIACDGIVYCLEYSQRPFRDLVMVCDVRRNMISLLGDATSPDSFGFAVDSADVVYQDVAQKNQAMIFMDNMDRFGASAGMLCIKARSEDVTAAPDRIFRDASKTLGDSGFRVVDMRALDPYEKDHAMLAVER